MLRRSHKKSRKGAKCDECRRRHIRCDEQRPICTNCSQADRQCSYKAPSIRPEGSSQSLTPSGQDNPSPTTSDLSSQTTAAQDAGNQVVFGDLSINNNADTIVNLTHLELFSHFGEIISPLFAGKDPDLRRDYLKNYQKAAFAGTYLMHEILAFAARHLCLTGPQSKSQFYADQATVLQTKALSLFNASLQQPKPETIIATFLFSSLLGTHLLSDTIAVRHMDLEPFLGHFVNYLKVHRGVRPIFDEYRQFLLNSELQPFLVWGWNLSTSKGSGSECQPIREMLSRTTLEQSIVDAYSQATDVLQSVIDGYKNRPAFPGPVPWVTVWLSMVKPNYTELLIARRPEALVVFAYYGAMIHCYHRDLWLVGESGKHIIELVTNSLGPEWTPWLKWPHQILEFSRDFATIQLNAI
ncbi:hypothetical protein AB5N19_02932 [Seiridium cardinale]|uniref:Zn(2)-C6 fungal-type domain-containing protein n=1 Tax=Seiridium cardinale TaxID=138064 RepID=A0ABR2XNI1_9PEZI